MGRRRSKFPRRWFSLKTTPVEGTAYSSGRPLAHTAIAALWSTVQQEVWDKVVTHVSLSVFPCSITPAELPCIAEGQPHTSKPCISPP